MKTTVKNYTPNPAGPNWETIKYPCLLQSCVPGDNKTSFIYALTDRTGIVLTGGDYRAGQTYLSGGATWEETHYFKICTEPVTIVFEN